MSERGFAVKEHAWATGDGALMADSISIFTDLELTFGGMEGEPFEYIVAIGVYNEAGALGAIGRTTEAAQAFGRVRDRCRARTDERMVELYGLAGARQRMMVSVPDDPAHIAVPLPDDEYWIVEGVERLEQVDWFLQRDDPEKFASVVQARLDAAVSSHRDAAAGVAAHRLAATPFALFLRSFDAEGFTEASRWPEASSEGSTRGRHQGQCRTRRFHEGDRPEFGRGRRPPRHQRLRGSAR